MMDNSLQTKIKTIVAAFKKEQCDSASIFECDALSLKGNKLFITILTDAKQVAALDLSLNEYLAKALPEFQILLTFTGGAKKNQKLDLPHIKHIIAVASGKGGVGKSTLASQMAYSLAKLNPNLNIGILDADIYGPSIPMMFNLDGKPELDTHKKLIPFKKDNLQIMSMGFMVDPERPIIWRGPMIQTGIKQLFQDVAWDNIDIMIVDMPPGTGDAHLTMAQSIPVTGAIIVSTPQDIALIDAQKGWNMYRKMNVPILGLIENMSLFTCPNCDHTSHIFGHHGAKDAAAANDIPFITELPLDIKIRETADQGESLLEHALHVPALTKICTTIMSVTDEKS